MHEESNELFVLQALAEHAQQYNEVRLLQFVMLHKSFDHYSQGLTEQARNQWGAVQGRFEEIPFIENTEQVLRVVSRAIEQDKTIKNSKETANIVSDTVYVLDEEAALPSLLTNQSATELFTRCYPLHPCSALLLPYLCQQVAQNERTLFSYLGSSESFGFQNMLSALKLGEFIYPYDIYDYFISNQTAVLGDFQTQRRWIEVVTAVERLGDVGNKSTIDLLKTIGIFNIVGAKGGLKPSERILRTCFESNIFDSSLSELLNKSIITHRKFNNEFRVWQGSDFDLQLELQNELEKLKGSSLSIAKELQKSNSMPPVVARKYTIQTGALRYFLPVYADSSSVDIEIIETEQPKIIFYLSDEHDKNLFSLKKAIANLKGTNILCVGANSTLLAQVTTEINAYKRISTSQGIHQDPIAKKELEINLAAAVVKQKLLLNELLYQPEYSKWYYNGSVQKITIKRDIQKLLSKALNERYPYTPIIFNELINKEKPSSQAASGRAKLMKAMLKNGALENLGIEKFPPEKAMYMAILKEHQLHIKVDYQFIFEAPKPDSSYFYVWHRISSFLDSTEKKAQSFAELSDELIAAPYGVKAGLLPIFYLHAYLVYKDDIAFYEEGKYQPVMNDEHIDRFIKRPDLFTFQLYIVEGLNASLINAYSQALYDGKNQSKKVIKLAQPLVKFYEELPEFTKATRSSDLLSRITINARDAIKMSKAPEKLIFEELPAALGFTSLTHDSEIDVVEFTSRLHQVIRELKNAYPKMLEMQVRCISTELHDGTTIELNILRTHLHNQYEMLELLAIDTTRSFVKHLIDLKNNDIAWLENILINLTKKHPTKWIDQDLAKAEAVFADISRRIRELLAISYEKNRGQNAGHDSDFDVLMLRSIKPSAEPKEKVITINRSERNNIDNHVNQLKKMLDSLDEHVRFAVLAQLVDTELPEKVRQ